MPQLIAAVGKTSCMFTPPRSGCLGLDLIIGDLTFYTERPFDESLSLTSDTFDGFSGTAEGRAKPSRPPGDDRAVRVQHQVNMIRSGSMFPGVGRMPVLRTSVLSQVA